MPAKKRKRTYNSTRRQAQADETRRQILQAAEAAFTERGFSGATVEGIAGEAGVSPETVYAGFGSKRNLLAALVDLAVGGDDQPVPLLQRPQAQAALHDPEPVRQVQLFSEHIAQILSRVSLLFEVMRMAAKTEPEIAALLERMLRGRLANMQVLAESLAAHAGLRPNLSVEQAAEILWVTSSPEVYLLLTRDRHWSQQRYVNWLADSLDRLLLN
jgi:AcrR family transcriptional regulator